ncbi:MAG: glucose-6-phosphate isomerase [Isosphaeraceae bacterium]
MNAQELWSRHQRFACRLPAIGLSLDVSRMAFSDDFIARMGPVIDRAFGAMDELERGAIANPDENRMVGHYWLRAPERAPDPEITRAIRDTFQAVKSFAADVHSGAIKPPGASRFRQVLSIGIGGSALGPQFVSDALGDSRTDRMAVAFLDNTDPDGFERVLQGLQDRLGETLCLVISKSGGTPETRNGMLVVAEAYRAAGLEFARHAVAVTGAGSKLDLTAASEGWLARFPMWDWVGGRTSETSAVGLLPAALQGIDVDAMLRGAAACDEATRTRDPIKNPAALMALSWYHATGGVGRRDMVVLPYKDRLLLFSRYLQQLIMESLGKRLALDGERVDQGLSVFGNKGSTDQHAYVQQLRDGVNNFFVTFVRVLEDGGRPVEVEPGVTSGDYLDGFLLGTRAALFENDRESMTLTINRVDATTVGALIALFERAVGFYATMIGINAYHQPGVEAGKKAAAEVLALQARTLGALSTEPRTAQAIADAAAAPEDVETIYLILERLAANGRARLSQEGAPGEMTFTTV